MRRLHARRARRKKTKRWVYAAWEPVNRRKVAIKKCSSRMEALRERNVMRSYPDDPHLVRYYDFFVRKRMGYIVMEWVHGTSLRKMVKRRGSLWRAKVIDIALDVLTGLDVLHRCGFVHGDLHSENVLVTDFDASATKLIDFQMAVRKNKYGRARARRSIPKPPIKLAPETRRRIINDSYDIYGVGFLCAYMMTGRKPRRRPRMTKSRRKEREIWRVIRKAMHRSPKHRYRSAKEMMHALSDVRDKVGHAAK